MAAAGVGLGCLSIASTAGAASPTPLVLSQSAAFAILGHSCGGIQEESFATGFGSDGYPQGEVHLQTRCGGSGRGGGYKVTTYTAWASVAWDWFGDTRSSSRLEGGASVDPAFEATDAHGDRIYNAAARANLETGEPPLQPAASPSAVSASVSLYEAGESEYLRMFASWTLAPETAGLVTASTVTASPVKPGPPVLTATASGSWTSAYLGPVQPSTTYKVTVTSTDPEGTSEPSAPIEVTSPNSDGEAEKGGGEAQAAFCEQNTGTIKLSPGLSETPHIQNVTIKGQLSNCSGSSGVESASYVDHLKTTEEVTCSVLGNLSGEPTTTPISLAVKWAPKALGTSHGSLVLPITEASGVALSGILEGGPFASPTALTGGEAFETFSGGSSCGLAEGGKRAKAVKSGTFSGTALEVG